MTSNGSRVSVLIVDDEPVIREALRALLELEPDMHVVGVATDAQEAIALAQELAPTVTVLDVRMPGGGGEQVAHELRRRAPGTKLLAFSAFGDRDSITLMRSLGVSAYLVKGASNADILATIRELGADAS